MLNKNNFTGGCPIGNLSLEMGDLNEKFQSKIISMHFLKWKKNY